jgi:hypothetical protein
MVNSIEYMFCQEICKMNYEDWRSELFGQSPDIDPVSLEHSTEF